MKYMGSKSRIAKDIVPILQRYIDENNIDTYVEPFVGGANVIDKIKCKKRIGFDLNKYLIALLNHVKDGGKLYDEVSKDLYDRARNALHNGFDEFELWEMGNIGFLASYNGRWFDGGYAKSGYEKTKRGERYRDYYREAKDNLMSQAENLKNITLLCCDYRECAFKNAVIYCDPPYNGTKKFANSIEFDYDEFWEVMREWSKDNIVIVSEQFAPDDFECIWEKSVSRSIKSNDKSRATEKLFVYRSMGVAKKPALKVSRPQSSRPIKNAFKLQSGYIECGDCLKLMKSIPDKSIDMVLCDLPYGTTKCKWDIALPLDSLWKEYNRIVKDNGAVVLFGTEPFTSALIMSNIKNFRQKLTWLKTRPTNVLNAKKQFMNWTEDICVFYRKLPTFNPQMRTDGKFTGSKVQRMNTDRSDGVFVKTGERKNYVHEGNKGLFYPKTVLEFSNVHNGNDHFHPTQKPIDLLKYLIKTYTNEGDVVLDNCCGSGSTCVACVQTKREYIGIELDANWYSVAVNRVNDEKREQQRSCSCMNGFNGDDKSNG